MISIKDFLQNYKYLEVINTDGIRDIDALLEKMVIQTNGIKINYDYPLGVKNYFAFCKEKNFCIVIKEDRMIKGFATLSIQNILINGEIQSVCYIGDLCTSPNLSSEGKRQWQNAFIDIVKQKDNIQEFCECKYFYALILKDHAGLDGILERLNRGISVNQENEYKIINIFARKYPILPHPPINLDTATIEELEEVRSYLALQKIHRTKDINVVLDRDIISTHILKQNCYITRDENNQINSVIICKENDLKRVHIQKMDSIFKMAGTLLPLFGRSKIQEGDTLNNLYFEVFEVDSKMKPLKRSEYASSIIAGLLRNERYKECALFTIPAYGDKYIERASKNFFSIESIITETIFLKKASAAKMYSTEGIDDQEEQKIS